MDTFDIMLYASYALVVIGVVVAILLPLINSLSDPKSLLKTGLSGIAILVLFFICYSISSNDVAPKFEAAPFFLSPGLSQTIGGMLLTTYILTIVALGSIAITEVIKGFK
jgi:uncharacterized membrane protein